jgi:glycerol-3-phosphate dehydrogenase (NAD(P)+)
MANAPQPYRSIAVVGGGAWGTALAATAALAGRAVTLYAREPEVVQAIRDFSENKLYLPGYRLPDAITATSILSDCVAAEVILLVVPTQHTRETLVSLREHIVRGTPVVVCAKGVERKTGQLLNEVMEAVLPEAEHALLSGPSFARDVVQGLPTAVTVAARGPIAERLQISLNHAMFRTYASTDLVGVALGGAAKNVYAIASGMVDGRGLGESARAAVIARSFAEMVRLGEAIGARAETLTGLSGLGDLTLTATSKGSRNYELGLALGQGRKFAELIGSGHPLAEGVYTAAPLIERAARERVEVPIAQAVADLLADRASFEDVVVRLMTRPPKAE